MTDSSPPSRSPALVSISKFFLFVSLPLSVVPQRRASDAFFVQSLSETEMDMCAYWTVKGHSSGDTLIRPRIHEYLGDGNEGILHCCMRMSRLPRGFLWGVCGQERRPGVARVYVKSVSGFRGVDMVYIHSCSKPPPHTHRNKSIPMLTSIQFQIRFSFTSTT